MTQHNDRPQHKPGDKVRVTVDATVIEGIPLLDGVILLELAYEGNGETNKCAFPLDAPSVTVEPLTETLVPSEAAALLGVHPKSLNRWADQGLVRVRRTPGGHRRYNRAEVEALLRGEPS